MEATRPSLASRAPPRFRRAHRRAAGHAGVQPPVDWSARTITFSFRAPIRATIRKRSCRSMPRARSVGEARSRCTRGSRPSPRGRNVHALNEVIRLARPRGAPALSHRVGALRGWYGAAPTLLRDLRGPEAEAGARAPRRGGSIVSPRHVPGVAGPETGQHFRRARGTRDSAAARGPAAPRVSARTTFRRGNSSRPRRSGTGWQASLAGVLGLAVSLDEGVEMNLLGLVTGFDVAPPALKLPGVRTLFPPHVVDCNGRIGSGDGREADDWLNAPDEAIRVER